MVACIAVVWFGLGTNDTLGYVAAGVLVLCLILPKQLGYLITNSIMLGVVLGLFSQIISIDVWMAAFVAALGIPAVLDIRELLQREDIISNFHNNDG
jgi:hypothetical protein